MTDLPELALEEAALKALADLVGERLKEVKELMQQQLVDSGATRVDATLADGVKVATISRRSPTPAAVVTDEAALLAWVREYARGEVSTRVVTEVRPAYRKRLLDEITAAGTPRVCDADTGELHDVPGVEVRATRSATHSVRLAAGGPEAIAAAWRSGALGHLGMPQLSAGAASEAPAA
ncbi:hypothetical protein [Streptomyces xiamenensis]|uniref:hypothetical protein n=1 Tax=Streptomyces xiamenensis TaxID=408015 RepID=UPI003D752F26